MGRHDDHPKKRAQTLVQQTWEWGDMRRISRFFCFNILYIYSSGTSASIAIRTHRNLIPSATPHTLHTLLNDDSPKNGTRMGSGWGRPSPEYLHSNPSARVDNRRSRKHGVVEKDHGHRRNFQPCPGVAGAESAQCLWLVFNPFTSGIQGPTNLSDKVRKGR